MSRNNSAASCLLIDSVALSWKTLTLPLTDFFSELELCADLRSLTELAVLHILTDSRDSNFPVFAFIPLFAFIPNN